MNEANFNNFNNNKLDQHFKQLLNSINIEVETVNNQTIEIFFLEVPISIHYTDGLIVFSCSFLLEYKPSAAFSIALLSTCRITEQPSIQVSFIDKDELVIWSREWLDKINDDDFYDWLERFCEICNDWLKMLEEHNSRQELREYMRYYRKDD